jgi:hypothetical protein
MPMQITATAKPFSMRASVHESFDGDAIVCC